MIARGEISRNDNVNQEEENTFFSEFKIRNSFDHPIARGELKRRIS
jgi:hypothetical protein